LLVVLSIRYLVLPSLERKLIENSVRTIISIGEYMTQPVQEALLDPNMGPPTFQKLVNQAIDNYPDIEYCYIIDKDNIIQACKSRKESLEMIRGKEYKENTNLYLVPTFSSKDVIVKEDKIKRIYDIEIPVKFQEKQIGKSKVKIGLSLGNINNTVNEMIKRIIFAIGIIFIIGVIISFWLVHYLVVPIKLLVEGTKEIAKGVFDKIVPVKTNDEIGILAESFNNMAKGLKQREQMKEVFSKLVSSDVMEEIMSDLDKVKIHGERKEITIFLSDIRGFTTESEKLPPEKVVSMLNEYFESMTEIVLKHKGTIDKYMGDGMLAIFGAPKSYGNDAYNAVKCALEMKEVIKILQEKWRNENKPEFKIGIGINSGYAVVGFTGSSKKMEYTVIGDAVNVCSRVEGLNKEFGTTILITKDTYNKVKDYFECKDLGEHKIKGREEPVQVYEVIDEINKI
jgi:adenylate cyclase